MSIEIHLASLSVSDSDLMRLKGYLTAEELRRGDRLLDRARRDLFFAGRGLLREILGRHLGQEPSSIRLSENSFGKPHLFAEEEKTVAVRFNVSHAGDLLLVAVSAEREVGVDLELVRDDLDYRPMAERYFSAREREELFTLAPEEQIAAFYRCWTRKEAYMKGTGTGFSQPSTAFDVSLQPGRPALLAHRGDPDEPARWSIVDLEVPEGYCAALALREA